MNRFRAVAVRLFGLLSLFALTIPEVATARPSVAQDRPALSEGFRQVPDEIRAFFEGGVSFDRFVALNGGKMPQALQQVSDTEVSVVIQLEGEPLAAYYASQIQTNPSLSPLDQQAYRAGLSNAQASVAAQVQAGGGWVIASYTKAYNGLLVRVPLSQLQDLQGLPGVKAIRRAPLHFPSLANSVEQIRAAQVIEELGIDGSGTTIAVIDTGVDYTHAAFGGPGTVEAYESNDRAVVEEGTFPTEKVIGGYDFAGPIYNPNSANVIHFIPRPDPDPLDGDGHGTHVADIAAGLEVEGKLSHGVAPGAKIYALKVFGEPAAGTQLAVNAIEWALDPNGDDDLSDHVDVINLSLGSAYGTVDPQDPENIAVEYATDVGVTVVASAGNSGDVAFISGAPAVADSVISVAASTSGFITGPTITITDTVSVTGTLPVTRMVYTTAVFDRGTGHFEEAVTAPIAYAGSLFATDTLCEIPAGAVETAPLSGKIALIQRGECDFTVKVNHAAELGAVAAIIFNHAAGGNERITMSGDRVQIPAGSIGHQEGLLLIQADGATITISEETRVVTLPDPYFPPDSIADFSSRGPRAPDALLKPDVTAPGVAIFAAKMGSGTEGVSYSGTSMAAPNVSGVAALVRQNHPDWSPGQVKAAILNTAVDLAEGSRAATRQGAGRVDAYRAVTAEAFATVNGGQAALNWGVLEIGENVYRDHKTVLIHDLTGQYGEYDVDIQWGENSPQSGVTLSAPEKVVILLSRPFTYMDVQLTIDPAQVPVEENQLEEYYGYIQLTSRMELTRTLRVPFYLAPRPFSQTQITDLSEMPRSFRAEIEHSGPVTASLLAYPLYEEDRNEPNQDDLADLRLVGMDYGFHDLEYGDIFIPAFNVYGAWFTPHPVFAEFDLYLDVDQDGAPDLANFNWNAGQAFGSSTDDEWVVVQVDLRTRMLSLASPYLIRTDYNSGLMEWALPARLNGLVDGDLDFDWRLFAFDREGNIDPTGLHYFSLQHIPFTFELSNDPGPAAPTAELLVQVNSREGIRVSRPIGVMLVNHTGEPGERQAHAITPEDAPFLNDLLNNNGGMLFLPWILR